MTAALHADLGFYRTRSLRRSQRWSWRLTEAHGDQVAAAGEGYTDRAEAERIAYRVVTGQYAAVPPEIYRTRSLRRSQRWAWRLRIPNGHQVAISGEGYANRAVAARMAHQVVSGQYLVSVVRG